MGLTFIAVVLLAAAWAAILLPDLRNRSSAPRRADSVKLFRQQPTRRRDGRRFHSLNSQRRRTDLGQRQRHQHLLREGLQRFATSGGVELTEDSVS